jgi:HEAT repeat protein
VWLQVRREAALALGLMGEEAARVGRGTAIDSLVRVRQSFNCEALFGKGLVRFVLVELLGYVTV